VLKNIVLVFKNYFSFALLCRPFSSVFFCEPQMGQVKDGEFTLYHVVTRDLLLDKCRNFKKSSRTAPVYDTEIFIISHYSWSKQFENKSAISCAELGPWNNLHSLSWQINLQLQWNW